MNIEQARLNMIEQQIRPWRVNDSRVLGILADVHREDFVPPAWRGMAFADTEVPLNVEQHISGQVMLAPKVEARILQALNIQPADSILEIGTGSGYGTALAAQCSRHISTWEIDPVLAEFAAANLARAGLTDLPIHTGDGQQALQNTDARWDVIILSGGVEKDPQPLIARLKAGGRLFCFVGEAPVMEARLYTRTDDGVVPLNLFETMAPALKGFPPVSHFHF
ncbi:MAG: protein-L-isoaspartate O-methyltransferase [Lautropia sp.]|nr:protein-L-isoaspartate O-methyltransferase [Lautropia sp.]